MPYLAIEDFKFGLDTRKFVLNSPAGTLAELINAHITPGGEVEKRKKFSRSYLPANCFGLEVTEDGLTVFGSVAEGSLTAPSAVTTTHRARTSDVATLTFASHSFAVGDTINVTGFTGGNTAYNGTGKTITAVTATTITYASTGADEATTADTNGSVVLNYTLPSNVTYQRLQHPDGSSAMTKVVHSTVYDGKAFVIAEFGNGGTISFYDGAVVDDLSPGKLATVLADADALAAYIASLVNATDDYTATVSNGTVTITGPADQPFDVSVSNDGSVCDGVPDYSASAITAATLDLTGTAERLVTVATVTVVPAGTISFNIVLNQLQEDEVTYVEYTLATVVDLGVQTAYDILALADAAGANPVKWNDVLDFNVDAGDISDTFEYHAELSSGETGDLETQTCEENKTFSVWTAGWGDGTFVTVEYDDVSGGTHTVPAGTVTELYDDIDPTFPLSLDLVDLAGVVTMDGDGQINIGTSKGIAATLTVTFANGQTIVRDFTSADFIAGDAGWVYQTFEHITADVTASLVSDGTSPVVGTIPQAQFQVVAATNGGGNVTNIIIDEGGANEQEILGANVAVAATAAATATAIKTQINTYCTANNLDFTASTSGALVVIRATANYSTWDGKSLIVKTDGDVAIGNCPLSFALVPGSATIPTVTSLQVGGVNVMTSGSVSVPPGTTLNDFVANLAADIDPATGYMAVAVEETMFLSKFNTSSNDAQKTISVAMTNGTVSEGQGGGGSTGGLVPIASPSSIKFSGQALSGTLRTPEVSVVVVGGTPPYQYLWKQITTENVVADSATGPITTFSTRRAYEVDPSTWVCQVTDAAGHYAVSNQVLVSR